jgi:hypothetical protein
MNGRQTATLIAGAVLTAIGAVVGPLPHPGLFGVSCGSAFMPRSATPGYCSGANLSDYRAVAIALILIGVAVALIGHLTGRSRE